MARKDASEAQSIDAKVAGFSYEEARSKLVDVVSKLEEGSLPLEDALAHWELGEALARRCQSLLDGARERLNAAEAAKAATSLADGAIDGAKMESEAEESEQG